MDIINLLLENEIFKNIKLEHLKKIGTIFYKIHFKKNFVFFNEGEVADSMFIIESGRASIQSGNICVFERTKNDCIGEMALFDNTPRSATVIALTSGTALKLNAADFNMLLEKHPEIYSGFIAVLLKKIRADFIVERKNLIEREKQRELIFQNEKLSAMGEMIGAIAHQWRQPLNSLSILVQEIKYLNLKKKLSSSAINKIVDGSFKQIQFMSDTIDDFRNYLKKDREKQDFNTVSAVIETVKLIYPQLKSRNIFIKINEKIFSSNNKSEFDGLLNCASYSILSYKNEFKQVILNLITNSRDSILEKRNTNNLFKGEIKFGFELNKNKIIIKIEDNGVGISKNSSKRIFEPYFSTKLENKGIGLGLYLSKMIIEKNMGGALKLSSAKPSAIFIIELKPDIR
ncbi:MAG TPA: cyclic nucleotide-binding domain-containing protein [bacterium]|nr:cyclic nucleotide-binding domain-containing protein [bacterium]HPN30917.1 cyclic nucleotide-binding domain-containing protein [bacterium]